MLIDAKKLAEAVRDAVLAEVEEETGLSVCFMDAALDAIIREQVQVEPVARVADCGGEFRFSRLQWLSADHSLRTTLGTELYTAPVVPVADEARALTDADILRIFATIEGEESYKGNLSFEVFDDDAIAIARAIEARVKGGV